MTSLHRNIFWDSCIFITYLTGSPATWANHIDDWLKSAEGDGGPTIYYSTLAMAEIKPSHLAKRSFGTFQDLVDRIGGTFSPIDPTPDIMLNAARMRDIPPLHSIKTASRVISMSDAIQLSSCVFAQHEMDLPDIRFHTLDHKAGTNAGEKTVPIIGLEDWFEVQRRNLILRDVCNLVREFPTHPNPTLPGVIRHAMSKEGNGTVVNNRS